MEPNDLLKLIPTGIPDVKLLEPKIFGDHRGFFFESYNQRLLGEVAGIYDYFVQDNHSKSAKNVLRGLHYQRIDPQGKLVRVVTGEIFDVAVDIRQSSPTFGKWVGALLTSSNKRMLWVPPGFAHGFLVLSDHADFLYKTTAYYNPGSDRCIRWDDPDLDIKWPLQGNKPLLSPKDQMGIPFKQADVFS
jgi:dTDP-4-dehydrorhamnose 3,5-epimerase